MRRMNIKNLVPSCLTAIYFFNIIAASQLTAAVYDASSLKIVEDFSRYEINSFPAGWEARGGEGPEVYRVKSDGAAYLEAAAEHTAVAIAKRYSYDLKEYPVLSWQWKAVVLPRGGDERYRKTGDSGAGIYVIFPGILPKNIKYVWSASLPVGADTESPYSSRTKIVVLRNQSSPVGKWVAEKINVYEDYKRLFGEEPGRVQAIGIMSDSDDTYSSAIANYRKIAISKLR
jgi:hypothetical protein